MHMAVAFMTLCMYVNTISTDTGLEFMTVPVSMTVNAGEQAMFTFELADPSIPANVRWQRNGVNLDNGLLYSGVTSDTLTISNVDDTVEGAYTVALTKPPGFGGIAEPCIVTVPNPGATPPDNLPANLIVGECIIIDYSPPTIYSRTCGIVMGCGLL